jgi:hypothetical protein
MLSQMSQRHRPKTAIPKMRTEKHALSKTVLHTA